LTKAEDICGVKTMPFIDTSRLPTGERLTGWKDRSFSSGKMTFAHFTFERGSKIHEHCHSNEEVWTVLDGKLEVTVGPESIVAAPGFIAIVPPYTAHSVRAISDGRAIVADCPVRVDPSGGRRGIVQVGFDSPISLPDNPTESLQIPFTLRNRGKTRVQIKEIRIESGSAADLPAATTTEIPDGELQTRSVLEPEERRGEITVYSAAISGRVFYVKGVILYDDDFGSRHHSTFCRVYDRNAFEGKGGFVIPPQPGYNYGT
jgi:quercetin dioxygenase-like cupin family protein